MFVSSSGSLKWGSDGLLKMTYSLSSFMCPPHQLHAEFIMNFYLSLYEIKVCGMTLSEAICYCVVKYKKAAC